MVKNSKNIIKIVTVLQRVHQIYMEVRKTPLQDGDGLGGQACVAVNLAPLVGQTPVGPGGDIAWKVRATQTWMKQYDERQASQGENDQKWFF
jgi:hypothetical protein